MADSDFNLELTRYILERHPDCFSDMATNAKLCWELSSVLGCLMSNVYLKKDEAYYRKSFETVMRNVDTNARKTVDAAYAMAHGMQPPSNEA